MSSIYIFNNFYSITEICTDGVKVEQVEAKSLTSAWLINRRPRISLFTISNAHHPFFNVVQIEDSGMTLSPILTV